MSNKSENQKSKKDLESIFEYDATVQQTIPFNLEKNGRSFRVSHTLKPLSDSRFILLEKEKDAIKKTVSRSQTEVLKPTVKLWDDLAISREGYVESKDFRTQTYMMDKVQAILGLLFTNVKEVPSDIEEPPEILDAEVLFNDEEANEIKVEVLLQGVLITTSHFFRQETQQQMDEYLAIISDLPSPSSLASMGHKLSRAERVISLYDDVHIKHYGYKEGTEVPAWHKLPAVMSFFRDQFNRMGR